ncbi:MAG: hypothetical protein P4L39_00815 [Humidesulfovibrio sp.]|nr:hypothetical protein [Humidesulfovibrio sp.]
MFSRAALFAVALVLLGYRWGKGKATPKPPSQVVLQPAPPPKASWLSVRVLLIIVIILLCIAILTSLQR